MNAAQFAIAKFIPDIKRMEPRNFGVVVWNQGDCASRFLGDDKSSDLKFLSSLGIPDKIAYFEWISYWRTLMSRPEMRLKTGEVVPRTESAFMDALCGTSLENFLLTSTGFLAQRMAKSKTNEIAQSLFDELVLTRGLEHKPAKDRDSSEALRKESNKALDSSGLSSVPGFRRAYDWLCPVGDTLQHFKFHFAIHKTKPEAVIQKVNLHRQSTVNDAAFMFNAMQSKYFGKDRCATLIFAEEADLKNDSVYQSFKLMSSISSVINVADHDAAVNQLSSLPL